jgi:hypothetical protein
MYDTINMWMPLSAVSRENCTKTIQDWSNVTEQFSSEQYSVTGYLRNYKVRLNDVGLSLSGSLAKYYLLDNFHTLTRADTKRAIEMLSDELHLPIKDADVRRIDVAQNLLMKHKPEAYYPYLGECQYYIRQPITGSLYYSNSMRQKVFYNKIAEGKAKGQRLPDIWAGENALRFEQRFRKRLPDVFNMAAVKASTLSDADFYIGIIDRWYKEYKAINKINTLKLDMSNLNSPKDFMRQLSLMAVNMIGQDKILQEIENLRHQKAFTHPEYYSQLKKQIKELCNMPDLTTTSELVTELDKKIEAAKRYCR